jgi:hypothetical protein
MRGYVIDDPTPHVRYLEDFVSRSPVGIDETPR